MTVKTYSPTQISISVAGTTIRGYADGTFVSIEHEDDAFTKVVGADGEVARTHSANESARITLTLMQTSSSNDVLSALELADRISLKGVFPVMVKDNNGRSLYVANEAWVVKPADAEFGAEMSDREWMIDCAKLVPFTGGNN